MRAVGKLAARILVMLDDYIFPGVTTDDLDFLCAEMAEENNATSAPLGYTASGTHPPYPKSICTSINHVICHGIPSNKRLKNGDIVNVDITVVVDGYHGDTSKMFLVGKRASHAERLVRVTQECLYKGIEVVREGAHIGDIGYVIQQHAHENGYSVVREFCGHGIGTEFHGQPSVPHFGEKGTGIILEKGQCFTIEPMINQGKKDMRVLGDMWTAVTKDHRLSAQWEHTLIVTEDGCEVFTLRDEETLSLT